MTHVSSGLNELFGEKIQNIALCFSSVLLIVQLQNQTAFKMTQSTNESVVVAAQSSGGKPAFYCSRK